MQTDESNIKKKRFLSLYRQLEYDYQCIILNTFKCLVSYEDIHEKGYKPFDVVGVLKYYQDKFKYTDQEVCDRVNELFEDKSADTLLTPQTYHKIKQRNTQSSKSTTNWLKWLAKALEFDEKEYRKLTTEGYERTFSLVTQHSQEVNRIETLYDLLSEKEQTAILQLTSSLLRYHRIADLDVESLSTEYNELQEENESLED